MVSRSSLTELFGAFRRIHNPRILIGSAVIGVAVALVMSVFVTTTFDLILNFVANTKTNIVIAAAAPAVGIVLTRLLLIGGSRVIGARDISSSTSDEYVRAFHERQPTMRITELPVKLLAGIATIGSGGAVGLEAPSIYTGSSLGLFLHKKLSRFFKRNEAHIFLTAGAAAGVSAAFRTPATGVIFALETPYSDDVAPQALVPSLISAAASYTTLVALLGSEPLVPPFLQYDPASQTSDRSYNDWLHSVITFDTLQGALILGVIAALAGQGFAWSVHRVKDLTQKTSIVKRVAITSIILAGLVVLSDRLFGQALSLGAGIDTMKWIFNQDWADLHNPLQLIAMLFLIRAAASLATVYGGGVGGLFIPLCTLGVILGQFVSVAIGGNTTQIYPILGLAAFLAAGYRTPITAVMFVAESAVGSGNFVVPALIAAAVSQVMITPLSVAEHQKKQRRGHLESRLELPVGSIVKTDVFTVPPDTTISEFIHFHVLGRRKRIVPVVKGSTYLGMARLEDMTLIEREKWDTIKVEAKTATHLPTAAPSWSVRDAVIAMEKFDTDILAVTNRSGHFIGTITEEEILRLQEILEETEE